MSRKGSSAIASEAVEADAVEVTELSFDVKLAPLRPNTTTPYVVLILASNEANAALRATQVAEEFARDNAHLAIDITNPEDVMRVSSQDDSLFGKALRDVIRLIIVTAVTPACKVPLFIRKNIDLLIVDEIYAYRKADNDAMAPPLRSAELRDELPSHFKRLGEDMAITYPRNGGYGNHHYWHVNKDGGSAALSAPMRTSVLLSAPIPPTAAKPPRAKPAPKARKPKMVVSDDESSAQVPAISSKKPSKSDDSSASSAIEPLAGSKRRHEEAKSAAPNATASAKTNAKANAKAKAARPETSKKSKTSKTVLPESEDSDSDSDSDSSISSSGSEDDDDNEASAVEVDVEGTAAAAAKVKSGTKDVVAEVEATAGADADADAESEAEAEDDDDDDDDGSEEEAEE